MSEDVTAYGATPDDSTDDTDAFIAAAEAAGGGTVYVPEGTFTLNSKRWRGDGALHFGPDGDHQPPGTSIVGAGPDKTTVQMEGGHVYNYLAFSYDERSNHDGAVIRDLTLDGNQFEQGPRPNGGTPNGFAIQIDGGTQDVLIENCRVKEWGTTGGLFHAKKTTVRRCSFLNNGQAVWQNDDRRGHGFNVGNSASSPDETGCLVEYCYFAGSSGTSIDNNGGNFTMRRCFSEDNQFAVKFNDGTRTTIENCRFRNLSHRGVYTVKSSGSCGRLEMRDVSLENVGREAIATRLNGDVVANNVHVDNANTTDNHNGEAIRFENKSVDVGTLCVMNSTNGGVFDVRDSSGSVARMLRGGNADGLGSTGGIAIENDASGDPVAVDAPTAADVGVNTSGGSTYERPSYDRVLKVEGNGEATYALAVNGHVREGSESDPADSVTQTADGNYLVEGKVLDGGVDSFEFSGELLPDKSTVDGDATVIVDGSQVDFGQSSTDSTTTTSTSVLKIEGRAETTYALVVDGEAREDAADPADTITQTADGNYLIEGKVLDGGVDSFEISGQLLPDKSTIEGDAAVFVDGTRVNLAPTTSRMLTVKGNGEATYALTVSGEAQEGPESDPADTITQTADGNYLIEGKVLGTGLDDFEFTGELLVDKSAVNGDAVVLVDGTRVDALSTDSSGDDGSQFGEYTKPKAGATDWHKPLNQNFDQIGQDVQELAARIEQLEKKLQ